MAGAKFFTKLDAKSGYWQLKLKDSSSYLTTFNTPFGRYRFTRLPFGINCAQDEFQRKMDDQLVSRVMCILGEFESIIFNSVIMNDKRNSFKEHCILCVGMLNLELRQFKRYFGEECY